MFIVAGLLAACGNEGEPTIASNSSEEGAAGGQSLLRLERVRRLVSIDQNGSGEIGHPGEAGVGTANVVQHPYCSDNGEFSACCWSVGCACCTNGGCGQIYAINETTYGCWL
jgi:hypothetical protein